ncbi:hypothetical protein L6164_006293 [Bauhinia variegata]|uniref:Uncharacterized protein n=1 Tax=Bauhinia variegata TaxID=167791 RepID=A0ACB9PTC7_BAUVA|nr:hypothetical protein L6164_006293 [Bauhinia variegata]
MRTSPFLALSFLLLAFTTMPFPSSAESEPVLDTVGEKLRAGQSYLILPAGGGPALSLGHYENDSCPLFVIKPKVKHVPRGQPVTFFSVNPQRGQFIGTSTDLNIKFTKKSSECAANSMVWRVIKRITEARFIGTDGVEGNPGRDTLFNWFQIQKAAGNGYSLVFCPTEICQCQLACSELGIYVGEDKKNYVGFADPGRFQPLRIVFKRVKSQAVMSI